MNKRMFDRLTTLTGLIASTFVATLNFSRLVTPHPRWYPQWGTVGVALLLLILFVVLALHDD
jgi:hypothetical protein